MKVMGQGQNHTRVTKYTFSGGPASTEMQSCWMNT